MFVYLKGNSSQFQKIFNIFEDFGRTFELLVAAKQAILFT